MTGAELKRLRHSLKLSQSKFADLIDTSVRNIQAWEVGARNMNAFTSKYLKKHFAKQIKELDL
jgi:DNA-binding transcriptional regulator YiaG